MKSCRSTQLIFNQYLPLPSPRPFIHADQGEPGSKHRQQYWCLLQTDTRSDCQITNKESGLWGRNLLTTFTVSLSTSWSAFRIVSVGQSVTLVKHLVIEKFAESRGGGGGNDCMRHCIVSTFTFSYSRGRDLNFKWVWIVGRERGEEILNSWCKRLSTSSSQIKVKCYVL